MKRLEPFNPLPADHPAVKDATPCASCGRPFVAGDVTTLIPSNPADAGERTRYAALVHWDCVPDAWKGDP